MKMRIRIDSITGDRLFLKCLKDKRVLSNSLPFILEDFGNGWWKIIHSDNGVVLLEDVKGRKYKVISSSTKEFLKKQSCQKGIGRNDSMGDWPFFVRKHKISYIIFVDTSNLYELIAEVVDV